MWVARRRSGPFLATDLQLALLLKYVCEHPRTFQCLQALILCTLSKLSIFLRYCPAPRYVLGRILAVWVRHSGNAGQGCVLRTANIVPIANWECYDCAGIRGSFSTNWMDATFMVCREFLRFPSLRRPTLDWMVLDLCDILRQKHSNSYRSPTCRETAGETPDAGVANNTWKHTLQRLRCLLKIRDLQQRAPHRRQYFSPTKLHQSTNYHRISFPIQELRNLEYHTSPINTRSIHLSILKALTISKMDQ